MKVWILKTENNKLIMGEYQKADFHDYCVKHKTARFRLEPVESNRTSTQNNALHLWFDLLAKELNDAGHTVQLVLKEKVELDWDGAKVKELLWRPAQQAILKKKSTTELKKIEDIDKVFDHLNRHIGEKFGIHVPFPVNQENQLNELR